jgi:hypothetical protein
MTVSVEVGGLIAAIVALMVALIGALAWLMRVENIANDAKDGVARIQEERREQAVLYNVRLERAEAGFTAINGLGKSIEHLADRLGQQINHLTERANDHNEFMKVQMAEIREDQRRQTTTRRPTAKASQL